MPEKTQKRVNPKEFFSKLESYPSKALGQNFIKDPRIIDRIAKVSELSSDDEVLEIGPGLGALTFALSDKARRVVAVEKDKKLSDYLYGIYRDSPNVEIFNQDALKADYGEIFRGSKLKVIANLPYSVSSPLLFKLLEDRKYFSLMVLMLQLEVGERITASPGGKTYGSISVLIQTFMEVTTEFRVSPESFWPKPKVDSVVLKLKPLDVPRTNVQDEKLYEKVVRAAFSSRRKMIANSLQSLLPKKDISESLELANIDKKRRAETLSIEEFGILVEKVALVSGKD